MRPSGGESAPSKMPLKLPVAFDARSLSTGRSADVGDLLFVSQLLFAQEILDGRPKLRNWI